LGSKCHRNVVAVGLCLGTAGRLQSSPEPLDLKSHFAGRKEGNERKNKGNKGALPRLASPNEILDSPLKPYAYNTQNKI